ncbi:MAG: tyrosine-type recombinase/integrase [Acidimicrobiales bacterium]
MMTQPWYVRASGPLAVHVGGFRARLIELGYAQPSVTAQMGLVCDLSGWLGGRGLGVDALDAEAVAVFAAGRRRSGRLLSSPAALRPLLGYLDTLGVLPAKVAAFGLVDVILADYRRYLLDVRCLAGSTMPGYMKTATRFAAECLQGPDNELADITAGDVAAFIGRAGVGYKPKTVNEIVVGLRSLLRFLYATGRIDVPLWEAALGMAGWHGGPLPGRLPHGAGEAILASCDRSTVVGNRDHAMIILIVRLGLRAGEVAAVELDDLRWGTGELVVRGKGGGRDGLPMPVDVGGALADYLCRRGTGSGEGRRAFLHVQAPRSAVTMTDVRAAVRRACWRAGMADTGTHRFRHSLASDMLGQGTRLAEIGQVLRHRHLETTALYAKVDDQALATVARTWPGSRP